jgi:hypothetical protein
MAVSMKMTAFWEKALSSLVQVDQRYGGAYCLQHQGDNQRPDNAGSMHL